MKFLPLVSLLCAVFIFSGCQRDQASTSVAGDAPQVAETNTEEIASNQPADVEEAVGPFPSDQEAFAAAMGSEVMKTAVGDEEFLEARFSRLPDGEAMFYNFRLRTRTKVEPIKECDNTVAYAFMPGHDPVTMLVERECESL